ncbi:MAG: hypothetical protein ACSHX7_06100 [Luteolibacter sp.]
MKTHHFIPPVLATVAAGILIAGQRKELSKLEGQSTILSQRIEVAKSRPATTRDASRPERKNTPTDTSAPIDWKEIASMSDGMNGSGGVSDMRKAMAVQRMLLEMDRDEIIAALDEIALLDITEEQRSNLISMLLQPLETKEPELALTRFSDRLNDPQGGISWRLSRSLGFWAKKDSAAATAWLDREIANGTFISKTLDGQNRILESYQGNLIGALLASDPDLAGGRLAALPADQRKRILDHASNQLHHEDNEAAFAELAREHLTEDEAISTLSQKASNLAMHNSFDSVEGYMDRISATAPERKKIAENAAKSSIQGKSYQKKITSKEIDDMREWLGGQSPGSVETVTGQALGRSANNTGSTKFSDAAGLALRYQEESGDDEVLISFLQSVNFRENKEQAHTLAEKISDPKKRESALERLK